MKTFLKRSILVIAVVASFGVVFTSCEKDEDDNPTPNESQFVSLESPYLICAGRSHNCNNEN
jgi:hypothetical protein